MPSSLTVLDPVSDVNHEELARLVKLYDFPTFVKKADLANTMRPGNVGTGAFADPRFKRYPCHSAAATWLSGLYFQEKRAEYHPKDQARIEQRLDRMVDYFKIRPSYETMVKQAKDLHKEAELPDSAYAYVWAGDDGRTERHLPLRSTMEVKVAAEWLSKYRDRLPFSDRNTVATKILEKAAHFGASLGPQLTDFIEKQAGHGVCDPDEVYQAIIQRARLATTPSHREGIVKLAQTVKGKPRIALQPQAMIKLAETLDITDRALGIREYGEILQRPEDVIFKITFTKVASDRAELCALTTGNVYSKDQFEKLSRDDVEGLFGIDFAHEVCTGLDVDGEKMAAVAHTLPRPDAELLDQLMAETGMQPQMAKSASAGFGLTNAQLEQLAAAYTVPS